MALRQKKKKLCVHRQNGNYDTTHFPLIHQYPVQQFGQIFFETGCKHKTKKINGR
jgi:hypothetical protein